MKSYEEFTNDDLQQFLEDNGFIRPSKRGADEPAVIDYDKLSDLLGCKQRQARNLVSGKLPLQRSHYNLLAVHSGAVRPQLCAQTFFVPDLDKYKLSNSDEGQKELLDILTRSRPMQLISAKEHDIAISEHPEPPRPA